MTATMDAVIPALQDVRDAQAAVVDRFQAHVTISSVGRYRRLLEGHIPDAQCHLRALDKIAELRRNEPRPGHDTRHALPSPRPPNASAPDQP